MLPTGLHDVSGQFLADTPPGSALVEVPPLPVHIEVEFPADAEQRQHPTTEDAQAGIPPVAEQREQGPVLAVELPLLRVEQCRIHVVAHQYFVVALRLQPLGDAVVAPERIVESAQREDTVEMRGVPDGRLQQGELVIDLPERAPADVRPFLDEMDVFCINSPTERPDVRLPVDVDEELGVRVQCPDEARQLGSIGMGGDEIGDVHVSRRG